MFLCFWASLRPHPNLSPGRARGEQLEASFYRSSVQCRRDLYRAHGFCVALQLSTVYRCRAVLGARDTAIPATGRSESPGKTLARGDGYPSESMALAASSRIGGYRRADPDPDLKSFLSTLKFDPGARFASARSRRDASSAPYTRHDPAEFS